MKKLKLGTIVILASVIFALAIIQVFFTPVAFGSLQNFGYQTKGGTTRVIRNYIYGGQYQTSYSGTAVNITAYIGFVNSNTFTFGDTGSGTTASIWDTIRGQRFTPTYGGIAQSITTNLAMGVTYFGYNVGSVSSSQFINNTIRGQIFACSESGALANIKAYIGCTTSAKNMKAAIYDGNIKVAETQQVSVPIQGNTWVTFNFADPKPVVTDGKTYALVVWSAAGSGGATLVSGGSSTSQGRNQSITYGSWPDPASFTNDNYAYDIYAEFANTVGNRKVQAAIYSDANTLVGITEQKNVSSAGVVTFNFADPKPTLIEGASYILAVFGGSDSGPIRVLCQTTGGAGAGRVQSRPYGSWPDPASFTSNDYKYTISCTYIPTVKVKAAIYSTAGALLGFTEERALANLNSYNNWYTFAIQGTKPFLTSGTNYTLFAWSSNLTPQDVYLYGDATGGTGKSKSLAYGSWPDPITGLGSDAYKYSIYCTVQTSYTITFTTSGMSADTGSATILTIDGTNYAASALPQTFNWVPSSTHTVTALTPVSSTITGKQYRWDSWTNPNGLSGAGPGTFTTPSADTNITANYVTQYNVTFAQSGLNSDASGTIVTVNGTAKTYALLPNSTWVDSGSSMNFSYATTVSSSTSGKQHVLTGVNASSPLSSISQAILVVGTYKTQYNVTFGQTGVSSDFTGTVVTVNGTTYARAGTSFWANASDVYNFSYASPLTVNSGKQYVFVSANSSSPLTVSAATTVTGTFKTQYNVTFGQSGVGSDFSGTVVTINSTLNYDRNGVSFWADANSPQSFVYGSSLTVSAGKQYVLTGANASSPLTVIAATTVTGTYKTQYNVTFAQSGVGVDFSGDVVKIDGTNYTRVGASFWWDNTSSHSFAFYSPLIVTANGKQCVWDNTTGLSSAQTDASFVVSASGSVTGNHKTQYYLTVNSAHGTSGGGGWYDSGYTAYATVTPLTVAGPTGTQYVFTGWTGDASGSGSPSNGITVNGPKTATAGWQTQYELTVTSAHGGPTGAGWYNASVTADFGVTSPDGVSGTRYVFTAWSGNSTSTNPSDSIVMTGPASVTAGWQTQYSLTVTSAYGSPSDAGWYDSGATPTAGVSVGSVDHGNGTQHVFTSWGTDASGTVYSASNPITMNAPKTATANWKTQYYLTVNNGGYGSAGGQNWYDANTNAQATIAPLTVAGSTGTQYVFNGWTGDASGSGSPSNNINMNGPKTATATWQTQYLVTYSATGNVLSVTVPSDEWVDSGGGATGVFPSQVTDTGTRCNFVSDNRTSITEPTLIVGTYQTQYEVTFDVSPGGSGTTTPSVSDWFDAGSSGNAISASANSGYEFGSWNKTGSITIADSSLNSTTITVDGSGTVTANFNVAVASTSLTVQCSPTTVDKSGSHITTISGYLTSGGSGVAGKTVELYYQYGASGPTGTPSDGTWTGLASVTTGSNGSYSVPWDPDESMSNGYYWIKASFTGAGGYSGSEATTGVDVAHNLLVVPVMPLGTLMAAFSMIVVLGAYGGLRRRKNRTSKQ